MAKNILIVENDTALSGRMRAELEQKGFAVRETQDAKGSLDALRRERPELLVMGVELGQGQNGYILCGKIKKDDELKTIPLIIVGNPDGFAQHKKLKTRADEYVASKKGDMNVQDLVERVGGLIGFPEPPAEEFAAADMLDEPRSEEIMVEEDVSMASGGDPDLDMLDAAFDASTGAEGAAAPQPLGGDDLSMLNSLGGSSSVGDGFDETDSDRTMLAIESPLAAPPPPPPAPPRRETKPAPARTSTPAPVSGADASELRELRAKVAELESALNDASARASEAETRASDLESQVSAKDAEIEAARSHGAGKSDKDFAALREAGHKKDKELLKLRGELNEKNKELTEKDSEIVGLREREMTLESQVSESSEELARRDAQIKTLTAKTEQLQNDKRKADQQLQQAKEETRNASAKLTALQGEVEQLQAQAQELAEVRGRAEALESELSSARDESADLRRQLEESQGEALRAREDADSNRSQLEQVQAELESVKSQLSEQATAFADEAAGLRRRIAELEENGQRHEERVTKFYEKIKGDEAVREKTKKALEIAMQLLGEQGGDIEDPANA